MSLFFYMNVPGHIKYITGNDITANRIPVVSLIIICVVITSLSFVN